MQIQPFRLLDDGQFPNNAALPVLLYKSVFDVPVFFPATKAKRLMRKNGWYNAWDSGIFTYHHYHSTTHEAIICYKGKAALQLGGPQGIIITLSKGDALIIPAGVAHRNLEAEHAVNCVGAYPGGRQYDIKTGLANERPAADYNIATAPLPKLDPIYGEYGGLKNYWK